MKIIITEEEIKNNSKILIIGMQNSRKLKLIRDILHRKRISYDTLYIKIF